MITADGKLGKDSTYLVDWVARRIVTTGGGGSTLMTLASMAPGALTNLIVAKNASLLLHELAHSMDTATGPPPQIPSCPAGQVFDMLELECVPVAGTPASPPSPSRPPPAKSVRRPPIIPGTTSNKQLYIGATVAGGLLLLALAWRRRQAAAAPTPVVSGWALAGLGRADLLALYDQMVRKPSAFSDDDLRQLATRLDMRNDERRADKLRSLVRRRAPDRGPASFMERYVAGVNGADDRVAIKYGVVVNEHHSGGFLPVIWVNGRMRGHTYGRGHDRADALRLARKDAEDEAAHYSGDWDISVAQGSA
jgi:hypothetical protein